MTPPRGGEVPGDDLPKARAAQPDDLVVDAEQACDLVSEHGGEIVIMPDGRVVFMNAAEHLVELAASLDPENPDIQRRLAAIERVRAARAANPPPAQP